MAEYPNEVTSESKWDINTFFDKKEEDEEDKSIPIEATTSESKWDINTFFDKDTNVQTEKMKTML